MTWRLTKAILISAVLLLFCSACNSTPKLEQGDGVNEEEVVSISYLKSLYVNTPVFIDREISVTGRVISSDRYDNIQKTLYIEDATGGIAIKIDKELLFEHFMLGSQVVVNCNSLSLGAYGGVIQLGVASIDGMYQVSPIPANILGSVVTMGTQPGKELYPTILTFRSMEHRYISCFVEFHDVQFIDEEVDLSWSDVGVSSDRHLIDMHGDTLIVRTNHYAQFASYILPRSSGNISGVLSYFNRKYQLIVLSSTDAIMTSERFHPFVNSTPLGSSITAATE